MNKYIGFALACFICVLFFMDARRVYSRTYSPEIPTRLKLCYISCAPATGLSRTHPLIPQAPIAVSFYSFPLTSADPFCISAARNMAGGRSSAKVNMMILRQAVRMERSFSKQAGDGWQKRPGSSTNSKNTRDSALWVPHPRTGVYFPEGHEWVVDDLPKHTATLKQTYWLRNVDGVDKPDPDSPPDYCFHNGL